MNNQAKSNEPIRETEIGTVMNNLRKVVQCLTVSVEATEVRLTGVVRNSNPVQDKEKSDTPYETNLAQNINKIYDKIQSLRNRLDDLLNRLEL